MANYSNNSGSKPKEADPVDKKIVPRANGTVKKKGEVGKLADIFLAGDVNSAKSYIFESVIVPAIKKGISDIVTNGIDILLYGETGHTKRNSPASNVAYNSCYNNANKSSGTKNVNSYSYDDIIFSSRGEAEVVLDGLNDIIKQYGFASVADLYELANITAGKYTDNNYGWTEEISISPARINEGYILRLPRVVPFNK